MSEIIERQTSRGAFGDDRVPVQHVDPRRVLRRCARAHVHARRETSGLRRDVGRPHRAARVDTRRRRPALPGRGERRASCTTRRSSARPDRSTDRATGSRSARRRARCSSRTSWPTGGATSCRCGRSRSPCAACTSAGTAATASTRSSLDLFVGYPELVHGYGIRVVFDATECRVMRPRAANAACSTA